MATGGSPGGDAIARKRECLKCSVCCCIFTAPKILPCFHTFCEKCLKRLADEHPGGTFPCPSCRKETAVPPGGVKDFQNNFYIDEKDLDNAKDSSLCGIHHEQMKYFCNVCEQALCLSCKVTDHELHETRDLAKAAESAEIQLNQARDRLKVHLTESEKNIEFAQQQRQAVKDKQSALLIAIRNRHATLQAAIDRYRDEAVTVLCAVAEGIIAITEVEIFSIKENIKELNKPYELIQHALDSDNICELVTAAVEVKSGRGSEEAVQKLTTSKQMTTVSRPVLRYSGQTDATLQRMRDYIGGADRMEMEVLAPEVTVMEQFRCRDDPDTDIYHLCPMTDYSVWISYEPFCALNIGVSSEKFSSDGKVINTVTDATGRTTLARKQNGWNIRPQPKPGSICTYAKKCDSGLIVSYRLDNDLAGKAVVKTSHLESNNLSETVTVELFTIRCEPHRAFDVDASEQLFVVLEEGKTPDFQRTVQLYRRKKQKSIATYSPPVAPFQPSDVCFYRLGGHEVLLVADELNDAIHVVNMQDGRLSFARYLSPGCPLLVQPTALNTDMRGRLWVACRGGRILTCTPLSTAQTQESAIDAKDPSLNSSNLDSEDVA